MRLLFGRTELVADLVARLIPRVKPYGFPKAAVAIGVVDRDNELIGGFVFHEWNPDSAVVEMSCASVSKRWWTRKLLQEVFEYPFLQLGCQMAVCRISERDTRLWRMLHTYGFKPHPIPRLYGRDEAAVVFTLTVEDWMNSKFTQLPASDAEAPTPSEDTNGQAKSAASPGS